MTQPRPMQSPDAILAGMGIPAHVRERWAREFDRCTTQYQVNLTAHCHQMEAYLLARYQ